MSNGWTNESTDLVDQILSNDQRICNAILNKIALYSLDYEGTLLVAWLTESIAHLVWTNKVFHKQENISLSEVNYQEIAIDWIRRFKME